jgi:nitroreductase
MDAITCLKTRRSIRTYADAPVPDTVVSDIIDCARLAPTAMNRQPWTFVAVRDASARGRIADLTGHAAFIAQAPVCIAVFCQEGDYWVEDGSAATLNLLNAARAHGLGSCWVAGHPLDYAPAIASLLGAPADRRLLSLVSIGWPGEDPRPEKRPLDDVLRWERF